MFSPMIWYNFYLISIVFRLKFLSAFHIFIICSNVSICIPYICLFIYMHIYIWNFFHCLQIVLKVSFSLVMLSSITVLGNAGWNSYFQSAFSPSWLLPAVPFISVKVSFTPSTCLICPPALFLLLFSRPCRAADVFYLLDFHSWCIC